MEWHTEGQLGPQGEQSLFSKLSKLWPLAGVGCAIYQLLESPIAVTLPIHTLCYRVELQGCFHGDCLCLFLVTWAGRSFLTEYEKAWLKSSLWYHCHTRSTPFLPLQPLVAPQLEEPSSSPVLDLGSGPWGRWRTWPGKRHAEPGCRWMLAESHHSSLASGTWQRHRITGQDRLRGSSGGL